MTEGTMKLTFPEWAACDGIKSDDADVAKFSLLVQFDQQFPAIASAAEGEAYVRQFMRDQETVDVLIAAIKKAWKEYATYNESAA